MTAADSNDDVTFAILDDAAAAELKVEAGKIALFKSFDDGRVDYTGENSAEDINAFVNSESLPLVSEFNDETAPKIFGGDITQHVLLFAAKSAGTYDENFAALSTAAKDFKVQKVLSIVSIIFSGQNSLRCCRLRR
jgi:protein disulfide-isomerase A1